ncbi:MAG: carbohydrate ABC transporter substrate-binding protein, partial [Agathobacter sp.]|nr:carbohydrate ABC transporter substrate-binding protein [Agathobacter sp.]
MKKAILGIVSMLFLIGAAGCGSEKQTASVRYWNTKPEVADVWEKIADEYYAETGVEVEIINPPTNSSDSTIKS